MSIIDEIYDKFKFDVNADRLGPDIPFTHWRLYFKFKMKNLCQKKFRKFGENSSVRPGSYIVGCSQIEIGSNVTIRPGTMVHAETNTLDVSVIIEDDVLIGSGVHIYVENHEFRNTEVPISFQGHSESKQVIIKKGAWIGANAVLLPGVVVGNNAVIAAGSVVTKPVPARVVFGGIPGKIIKYI